MHTRLFFMLFLSLLLQAGISPVTFLKDMNRIPTKHVTPCNCNEGYPRPTRARVPTGDTDNTYPSGGDGKICNAIAFEDPSNSSSDKGQRHPLQSRLDYLYVEDNPSL